MVLSFYFLLEVILLDVLVGGDTPPCCIFYWKQVHESRHCQPFFLLLFLQQGAKVVESPKFNIMSCGYIKTGKMNIFRDQRGKGGMRDLYDAFLAPNCISFPDTSFFILDLTHVFYFQVKEFGSYNFNGGI